MPLTDLLDEIGPDPDEVIDNDVLQERADTAAEEEVETNPPGAGVPPGFETVETAEDLAAIADDLDGDYQLVDDIDLSGEEFDPLGDEGESFEGTLDGNGHTISGLSIDKPSEEYVGLFGDLSGTVQNLTVSGAEITADGRTGVIAGRLIEDGIISNVSVDGTVAADGIFAGGIAGQNGAAPGPDSGTIESSVADVDVNAADVFFGVGGAVGWNAGDIVDVRAEGDVVGGDQAVGGVVGLFNDTDDGKIVRSSAHGNVEGEDEVGGVVGDNEHVVKDSYATGDVSGNSEVGGAIGKNAGETARLYAAGSVSGSSDVGGLAGNNTVVDTFGGPGGVGELNDSYWDTDATGQADAAGADSSEIDNVEGLVTGEMTGGSAEDNMDAFDFEETWETVDDDYPQLQ